MITKQILFLLSFLLCQSCLSPAFANPKSQKIVEMTIQLDKSFEQPLKHTLDDKLSSFLNLINALPEQYEVLGVLKSEQTWFVIAKHKDSEQILIRTGGASTPYQKTGFDNHVGYHIAQVVNAQGRKFEKNLGNAYTTKAESLSISCLGSTLKIVFSQ